jgi:hypothetical protein
MSDNATFSAVLPARHMGRWTNLKLMCQLQRDLQGCVKIAGWGSAEEGCFVTHFSGDMKISVRYNQLDRVNTPTHAPQTENATHMV